MLLVLLRGAIVLKGASMVCIEHPRLGGHRQVVVVVVVVYVSSSVD